MGEVYRARDKNLGREVAIKVLPEGMASDSDRLRRFEQEARAAASLNHPNIIAIYRFGATDAHIPYLVTELLQGQTLRERLLQGRIPVRKVLDYALQIARGLVLDIIESHAIDCDLRLTGRAPDGVVFGPHPLDEVFARGCASTTAAPGRSCVCCSPGRMGRRSRTMRRRPARPASTRSRTRGTGSGRRT